jgi:hypothetical protein
MLKLFKNKLERFKAVILSGTAALSLINLRFKPLNNLNSVRGARYKSK